jgi:glutathione peroxidase
MTSKNAVIGKNAHPLYKWVISQAGDTAAPRWNFHKYLIGVKGELAGTFGSKVAPDDAAFTTAIEAELNK